MAQAGLRRRDGGLAAPPYSKGGKYDWDKDLDLQGILTADAHGLSLTRYELREYFHRLPKINADIQNAAESTRMIANRNFEILGTNASNDDVTFASTIGGIELQTDGASGDQVIVLPHLDAGQSAWEQVNWGTENQVIWECVLRTGASIADIVLWAGLKLTNTSVVATDADQAFFRFDGGVANWEAVSSVGGSDTEADTGVVVEADTNYHLRVEVDADRVAHFLVNGVEKATSAALTDNVDLIPYVGVQASAAAAKTLNLVAEYISRIIFE